MDTGHLSYKSRRKGCRHGVVEVGIDGKVRTGRHLFTGPGPKFVLCCIEDGLVRHVFSGDISFTDGTVTSDIPFRGTNRSSRVRRDVRLHVGDKD